MNKMWTIGLKSGIITFLGLIAYGLLLPSLGLSGGGLEYVVIALGIYSGHYYYKDANNGLMSYAQGLKLGLIVVSLTGLANGLIIYFATKYADPSLFEQLIASIQETLQRQRANEQMIEEISRLVQHMSPALLGAGTFASTVLLGFATTLLVSAFSRAYPSTKSQE